VSVELVFLGATGTVTGSKYLVRAGDSKVLVDCGLFQGLKALRLRNWAPPPVKPQDVHALVLTHAHLDHSGYLPRFIAQGFAGPVHASPGTRDLCAILLPDSGHLQEEAARYANKRGFSKHKPALPLYTEDDARESLKRCVGVHGIFSPDALDALRAAGAARIVTTNTIAHQTNAIDITANVARGVQSVNEEIRNAIRIR